MKKYTPIILLSLAIAAIVFYSMTKNEPIKVGQSAQKELKNSSFVKEIALRIPEISDHSELKLMNGKGDFEIDKHANENQIFSFRNDSFIRWDLPMRV